MTRVVLVVLAVLLCMPVVAMGAPEPGNPDLSWTNNGTYDGIAIERAPVTQGKCGAYAELTRVAGVTVAFTDTSPLIGRACYRVRGFILVDFGDGGQPTPTFTAYSNADSTKPKGPNPFRAQ